MRFLRSLQQDPLYQALCAVSGINTHGNLLERTDPATAESQVETIRWALWRLGEPPAWVVETGTNRALFGYLLSRIAAAPLMLDTIDPEPRSLQAVATLNAMQDRVRAVHHCGLSGDLLPLILRRGVPGLAWVDGDHSEQGCIDDLIALADAHTPMILVDDADHGEPGVQAAIARFLNEAPYTREAPPWALTEGDRRGIAVLMRRG